MANTIGLTEVGDGLATVIAAQALGYLRANTVLARLVNRDWSNEVSKQGQSVQIPYTGALTVYDKSAGTVVTKQTPADGKYTVTLDQHREITFIVEDIAKALATPDYLLAYMQDGLSKLREDIDGKIAALYSGFSQSINATAGLGELDLREARRLLNAAKAPMTDRSLVLHEDAEFELLGIEKVVNSDYAASLGSAAANSWVGRSHGFNIFMDQMIATAGGEAKSMAFQKNAITLASRPLPLAPAGAGVIQRVMDEDGIGIRVTLSYNADYLGMQCTLDVLFGVAELRDNHGVVIRTTEI